MIKRTFVLGAVATLLGGCGQSVVGEVNLPEGETNLSCAALIFAAKNLVEFPDTDAPLNEYIGVMTRYSTAHAEETGMTDGLEAFNAVKIEAYAMTGRVGGRSMVLSDNGVNERAKACYEA